MYLDNRNVAPNNPIIIREGCSMVPIEWHDNERGDILLRRQRANVLVHGLDSRDRREWLDRGLSHPALLIVDEHIVERSVWDGLMKSFQFLCAMR